jgi:hypothetical protein
MQTQFFDFKSPAPAAAVKNIKTQKQHGMAKLDPDPESASLLSRVCWGVEPLQRCNYVGSFRVDTLKEPT